MASVRPSRALRALFDRISCLVLSLLIDNQAPNPPTHPSLTADGCLLVVFGGVGLPSPCTTSCASRSHCCGYLLCRCGCSRRQEWRRFRDRTSPWPTTRSDHRQREELSCEQVVYHLLSLAERVWYVLGSWRFVDGHIDGGSLQGT